MPFRPSIVPAVPASERELEIKKAEQGVFALEEKLAQEAARLEGASRELGVRLTQVKAQASQLQMAGVRDGKIADVERRVHASALPASGVDEHREAALNARAHAVNVRMQAAERIRAQLQLYAGELNKLAAQLSADGQALDEAARQHEQAQQAARARAAAPKTEQELPIAPPPLSTARGIEDTQPDTARQPIGKMTQTVDERRPAAKLDPRGQRRVRMQASIDLGSETNFFQGFSTNISEGGLFVATVNMLPRGTEVDLHFTLPGGRKIDVKGVVRWVREVNDQTPDIFPGVGVQFSELTREAAEAIRSFVSEREPLFFPD